MKNIRLAFLGTLILVNSALGQGNVLFQNVNSVGLQAYVYESDGVTKLSGPQFQAALINSDNGALLAQTGFLTGVAAGIFTGGVVSVPGVSGGSVAHLQVEVWNNAFGATFPAAAASGQPNSVAFSPILNILLTEAPNPPALLGNSIYGSGLQGPLYLSGIPEPASIAVLGLGAVLVVLHSRSGRSRRFVNGEYGEDASPSGGVEHRPCPLS